MPHTHTHTKSLKTERKLQNTIYEARMTLILKPNKNNKKIKLPVNRYNGREISFTRARNDKILSNKLNNKGTKLSRKF